MAGNHTMGAGAAYRKGRACQMADCCLQNLWICAVIQWERNMNAGNFHDAHNAAGHTQQTLVTFLFTLVQGEPGGVLLERSVVKGITSPME